PQDVTNATLVIAEAHPADSGQYHVVVSNPLGGATSANATVLITAETNGPTIMSVQALATPSISSGPFPFVVRVVFNARIDPTTGAASANYVINNGQVAVNQVTLRGDLQATSLGTDWKVAFLQTAGLTPGQQYTLKVSGVKDQAQTPVTITPQTITFTAPPLVQGALSWDYYYEVTPQAVSSLQSFPYYYMSAPTTNGYLTAFDTDLITGGDLNNNPTFGGLGDNYGDVVSGFLTPTVSGDYYFFLASDDASELDLSTDSTVANATPIANEFGCCHGFLEPADPNNSGQTTPTPITLTAGTPYFIRALHTEGGGGDYVKVAWRLSTDNTPATNLTAIASQYLSTFRLVAPAFNPLVFSNGQLTLSWTGTGTLLGSTNVALPLGQWTTITTTSPYQVRPASSGPRMFYRLTQ
ncbi:MAG: PA14 domain-containing protein, partial [Limisphaerales bacterium]